MTCIDFDEQHLGKMIGDFAEMFSNLSCHVGGGAKFCPTTIEAGAKSFDLFAHLCANNVEYMNIARTAMLSCLKTPNFNLDFDVGIAGDSLRRIPGELRNMIDTHNNHLSTVCITTAWSMLFFTHSLMIGLKTSIKTVK